MTPTAEARILVSEHSLNHAQRIDQVPRRRTADPPGAYVPIRDKRSAIASAAARLFAEKGFHRTTTKAIAREAGVAEGTIYTYFRSKHDILLAFAEEVGLESMRRTFQEMDGRPDEELVTTFIESRLRLLQEYGPVMKALLGQALFDPHVAHSLRTRIALPGIEIAKAYIERRVREGGFRDVHPDTAARALLGQFLGLVVLYNVLSEGGDNPPPPQIASELASIFLKGVSK